MLDRTYYCFDALFPWHQIETLGLSTSAALNNVLNACTDSHFVLDGWHSSGFDKLPDQYSRYIIYAPYSHIIRQYRVEVRTLDEHRPMYKKWYVDHPNCRYFLNNGSFIETTQEEYLKMRNFEVDKAER